PRRFYPAAAGTLAFAGLAVIVVRYLTPILGCGTVVVLGMAVVGIVAMLHRALRFGSVAVASPERHKATQTVAEPAAPAAPNQDWNKSEPIPVEVGQRLPVRLCGSFLTDGTLIRGFAALFGALF